MKVKVDEKYKDILGKRLLYTLEFNSKPNVTVVAFVAGFTDKDGVTIKPLSIKALKQKMRKAFKWTQTEVDKRLAPPYDYVFCIALQNGSARYAVPATVALPRIANILRKNYKVSRFMLMPEERGSRSGNIAACSFA